MASDVRPRSKVVIFAPIALIQTYLGLTVAAFALGPWQWNIPDPVLVYGFLVLAHLALLVGFSVGVGGTGRGYIGRFAPPRLVLFSAIVALVLALPTSQFRTGNLLPDVVSGLQNPGTAYEQSARLRFYSGRLPVIEYLRFFLGPVLVIWLPVGVFFWKKIKRSARLLMVMAGVFELATYIASGTNKAIADYILLFSWIVWGAHLSGNLRLSRRAVLGVVITAFLGIVFFVGFFTSTISTRGEGSGASVRGVFSQVDVRADYDHPAMKRLPPEGQVGFLGLCLYFSVGYQALAMSLEEPWAPCFGIGNSYFLQRQVQRWVGDNDLWRRSYPARLERRGWDSEGLWSSIYPWIASDVSFPGTLLVVFLVGLLFGKLWLDVLVGRNPFAVALFAQVVLMLFYFPANNQLMQSGEGLSAFLVSCFAWAWTRSNEKS